MYKQIVKPILFFLDPEKAHYLSFSIIKKISKLPFLSSLIKNKYSLEDKRLERKVGGIIFKNPVGLAAGFDKDALLFKELSNFGFGFIEIGTLTPKPQEGNPKKRLFRLIEDEAIINRMGFNNKGVLVAVEKLKKNNSNIIIGGNIGKNKVTPNEDAIADYIYCFKALYNYVDYFVVNVSSPNTPNLRALQEKEPLQKLLTQLQDLNKTYEKIKPIFLKIAPDLSNEQLLDIIEIVENTKIEGVIATNTTLSRENLKSIHKIEIGGLSGKPLKNRATEVISFLNKNKNINFTIIGVGGIHSAKDAIEKLEAGASLIQLYTGFIYEGPSLVKEINKEILKKSIH